MKNIEFKKELKNLTVKQLQEKIENFRKELFSLRLNSTTAHVKDYSQFKKFRKKIACALTIKNQSSNAK
ncbi:MAG: 50S ribosomal protein L29 [Candidatus Babeliales bacterium]|jgi:large subunit ribosomal protein L29